MILYRSDKAYGNGSHTPAEILAYKTIAKLDNIWLCIENIQAGLKVEVYSWERAYTSAPIRVAVAIIASI